MEIRPLGDADAATYWNLRLEALQSEPFAFGKAAEEHQATSLEVTAGRFRATSGEYFTLGAFEGEHLIGIATFIRETGVKERHKGRIYGVYVTASQRGKGVGDALMAALFEKSTGELRTRADSAGGGNRTNSRRPALSQIWFQSLRD